MLRLPAFTAPRGDNAHLLDRVHHAEFQELCQAVGEASIDMILCDLPYGTTACIWDTIIPFEVVWRAFKRVIKPRGAIVLTASQPFTSALVMSNVEMFRYEWIWGKEQGVNFQLCHTQPLKIHENIVVFSKEPTGYYPQGLVSVVIKKTNWRKARRLAHLASEKKREKYIQEFTNYPTSILRFDRERGLHPTQKPLDLFAYLIRTYTREGDTVFDPCCGSGTTAAAARACKRHFICGDLSHEYVLTARDRLRLPFEPRQRVAADDVSDLPLFASERK